MKKRSLFFILGIVLIGAALPTILGDIAQGLGVEVSSLGVLTSLPLLMFALFSSFATRLAQKIGLEHLFTYSLIVLTIGSVIRIFNLPLLYLGTLLIGASVAIFNVLLPSAIQENYPQKISFLSLCSHYSGDILERLDPLPILCLPTNFSCLVPQSSSQSFSRRT